MVANKVILSLISFIIFYFLGFFFYKFIIYLFFIISTLVFIIQTQISNFKHNDIDGHFHRYPFPVIITLLVNILIILSQKCFNRLHQWPTLESGLFVNLSNS